MKRPLCVFTMLVAAAVLILIMIFPQDYYSDLPDRAHITQTGEVIGKELKTNSYSGEKELIVKMKLLDRDYHALAYLSPDYEPDIGQIIRVSGECRCFDSARNPGEFDSRSYYRTLKTAYRIKNAKVLGVGGDRDFIKEGMYDLKMSIENVMDSCMEPEDAGIMKAIVLGDKNELDDEIKDIYKRNGIIHIIAVSGLHISLIGLSLYKLLRKTSLWTLPSAIIAATVMYLYGVMCGMSTSAYRAILMFAVRLFADVIGRTYDMLSALSLSAMLLLLEQPLYITNSGFLLSFGAIIGIGYVLPAFPVFIRTGFLKPISASLAITTVTLPVYTSFYYTFPIFSVFLNLLILPLMGVLMLGALLCSAVGALFVPAGQLFGLIDHYILKWFLICCNTGDMLPFGTWYVGHSCAFQVAVYVIMLVAFVLIFQWEKESMDTEDNERGHDKRDSEVCVKEREKTKKKADRKWLVVRWTLLFIGMVVLCYRPSPELKITAVDVGQGDGIVIESKGIHMMIDGGSTSKKDVAKYQLVPFLSYEGIGALDAVILTHEDEDHMSGILELMGMMEERRSNIRIRNLILPDIGEASKGDNYRMLEAKAAGLEIPTSYVKQGDELNLDSACLRIKCIGPVSKMVTDEPNAYSTILLLKCGDFSGLFTGDVEGTGQENLKEYIRKNPDEFSNLTLLKVAHHGSGYTTDEEFLELIHPRISLISCGVDNRYGHPHKELVERLEKIGTRIYRTDESGAITLELRHSKLIVDTFIEDMHVNDE
ncbi:DNA internalization-related competence protein ComEC/Rec2 [Butyrivibrio sp. AE3006]|uniref:DNA internalization-related competence protein ComEC/Rec2 n=1 Tax=Butyrivibrio sp. AE3006 TaxID=1280673 RepID=UPI00040393FA|nr:DNA internalization-related competence protein ComEC/Rec2 [Butyrivibrio sp. AE3006]